MVCTSYFCSTGSCITKRNFREIDLRYRDVVDEVVATLASRQVNVDSGMAYFGEH